MFSQSKSMVGGQSVMDNQALKQAQKERQVQDPILKEINAYIRAKSLQDKENGRKIHPDAALTKLLQVQKGDELTYFNLQRYMKHHFIKAVPASA